MTFPKTCLTGYPNNYEQKENQTNTAMNNEWIPLYSQSPTAADGFKSGGGPDDGKVLFLLDDRSLVLGPWDVINFPAGAWMPIPEFRPGPAGRSSGTLPDCDTTTPD